MIFPVQWSDEAYDDYIAILKYLDENFGSDTALVLFDKIDSFESNISKMPKMYPATRKSKKLRKAVILKFAVVFYYIGDEKITIVSVVDARNSSH